MASTLNQKLRRDVVDQGGQVLTIAVVVACGIAALVATQSALLSLREARETFYAESSFGDVFAAASRAPIGLSQRLQDIEGVTALDLRIRAFGRVAGGKIPADARAYVVSIPQRVGRLYMKEGSVPARGARGAVVVSDAFAAANDLTPGDTFHLTLDGRIHELSVSGIAISPEHIVVMSTGDMTFDPARIGVLWIDGDELAAMTERVGTFNELVVTHRSDVRPEDVMSTIDHLLRPYGGTRAYARAKQPSHYFLDQELTQLASMSTQVPPLFLLIAAFLLHVVLGRMLQLQRGQVAALKALGYSSAEIFLHYVKFSAIVVSIGALLGIAFGAFASKGLIGMYAEYYRFPNLHSSLDSRAVLAAVLVSFAAGVAGTWTAVRTILRLPPAEAMRPPAPSSYKRSLLDTAWAQSLFTVPLRMVFRDVLRKPWRLLFSVLGISVAVGLLVLARFFGDAMDYLVDEQMAVSNRWHFQSVFSEALPRDALSSIAAIPGVQRVEGQRIVQVEIRSRHRVRLVPLKGYEYAPRESLDHVLDEHGSPIRLHRGGLVVTKILADRLQVEVGDRAQLHVQEGRSRVFEVPILGVSTELMGMSLHAHAADLQQWLGESPHASVVLLTADASAHERVEERLRTFPKVVSVLSSKKLVGQFREQSAKNVATFSFILTLFGILMAVGVVYNNARVALSSRERELASLRVLGFRNSEISQILLAEIAVDVITAIPFGLFFGYQFSSGMAAGADPEMFRLPTHVSMPTYLLAVAVTALTAIISGIVVQRRLRHLDLVAVLKTRE